MTGLSQQDCQKLRAHIAIMSIPDAEKRVWLRLVSRIAEIDVTHARQREELEGRYTKLIAYHEESIRLSLCWLCSQILLAAWIVWGA